MWDSLPKPILPNSAKCPYLAHFAELILGKVGIETRQTGHRNSAKWASKFGKLGTDSQETCLPRDELDDKK